MKVCKCQRELLYNSDMEVCHYCDMKAKLQIAVDVLERYAEKEHWDWDRDIYGDFKLDTKNVFLSDKLGYTKAHDALEKIGRIDAQC